MKNETVGISVIVPVYKGIRFLRSATDSLRAQTFPDWECILVDDGSKDGSGALADEIAAEDGRIRVIHQPNGGTSVARNTALSAAQGRYIAFLDEDDVYHPKMLETLHDVITRTGADVVGCDFARFEETAEPDFSVMPPDESTWRVFGEGDIAELAADGYKGVPYEIWRNLYRRELVAGHPFPAGIRVEQDQLWIYTLLPRIQKYVRISWTGYGWRASSIGGYLNPDFASMMSRLKTTETILRVMRDEMRLTRAQFGRFCRAMALDFEENIVRPMRLGYVLSRDESRQFRQGLRKLEAAGIDVRSVLHRKKRFLWTMFMLTGSTCWIRK